MLSILAHPFFFLLFDICFVAFRYMLSYLSSHLFQKTVIIIGLFFSALQVSCFPRIILIDLIRSSLTLALHCFIFRHLILLSLSYVQACHLRCVHTLLDHFPQHGLRRNGCADVSCHQRPRIHHVVLGAAGA